MSDHQQPGGDGAYLTPRAHSAGKSTMKKNITAALLVLVICILNPTDAAQIAIDDQDEDSRYNEIEPPQDIRVQCETHEILVYIDAVHTVFTGMVYPLGLSKNSSCMFEFNEKPSPVQYRLPLRSCNTMSTQMDNGSVEYYNTIVVQPHKKLVTSKGRGFHVRCRYQPKDDAVVKRLNSSTTEATSLSAAKMPMCTMRIYNGDTVQAEIAENVKIGDPLSILVTLDKQDTYGLFVTDCIVQDGLGWGEQHLIDGYGCPVDNEIMGPFHYNADLTNATVHFHAHKFPYTVSVYYQCSVHLCVRLNDGCKHVPPTCTPGEKKRRNRRDGGAKRRNGNGNDEGSQAMIEVYSGLYVNEATDLDKSQQSDQVSEKAIDDPYSICVSQRSFAIGIAIAGLVLMLLTMLAVLFILTKHQKPRKAISTTGSSIYSGPYTNTAYSHTS